MECFVSGGQCVLLALSDTSNALQVGVCHSDYHQVLNEWGNTMYPVVPAVRNAQHCSPFASRAL